MAVAQTLQDELLQRFGMTIPAVWKDKSEQEHYEFDVAPKLWTSWLKDFKTAKKKLAAQFTESDNNKIVNLESKATQAVSSAKVMKSLRKDLIDDKGNLLKLAPAVLRARFAQANGSYQTLRRAMTPAEGEAVDDALEWPDFSLATLLSFSEWTQLVMRESCNRTMEMASNPNQSLPGFEYQPFPDGNHGSNGNHNNSNHNNSNNQEETNSNSGGDGINNGNINANNNQGSVPHVIPAAVGSEPPLKRQRVDPDPFSILHKQSDSVMHQSSDPMMNPVQFHVHARSATFLLGPSAICHLFTGAILSHFISWGDRQQSANRYSPRDSNQTRRGRCRC